MFLDTRDACSDWVKVYKLATTFIQPRPIALVSTVSSNGTRNLAPYSFYNMVSANPPVVFFSPSIRSDGTVKDTLTNIEETKEFVIATVSEEMGEQMSQCSYEYPPEEDEFTHTVFSPDPAKFVKPALVHQAPVNIECTLVEIKSFGQEPGAGQVVFGRIVAVHVDDKVLAGDGLVDPEKLKALGRLGRSTYVKTSDRFDIPAPERG